MSFPILASEPANTAWIRRPNAEPDLVMKSGTRVRYLAAGSTTSGQIGVYQWDMTDAPGKGDPHFHRTFAESFFIRTGVVHVYDGSEWKPLEEGGFFYVPPGGIHSFENRSGAPASMLIIFTPGAPREDYFENLHLLATMSAEEKARFYEDHDNILIS